MSGWREPDVEAALSTKLIAATNPRTAGELVAGFRDKTRTEAFAEVDALLARMRLPDDLQHTLNVGTYRQAWQHCRAVVTLLASGRCPGFVTGSGALCLICGDASRWHRKAAPAGKDTSDGTQPPAGESTRQATAFVTCQVCSKEFVPGRPRPVCEGDGAAIIRPHLQTTRRASKPPATPLSPAVAGPKAEQGPHIAPLTRPAPCGTAGPEAPDASGPVPPGNSETTTDGPTSGSINGGEYL